MAVSSPFSGHQLAEDALADLGISRQIVIRTPYYTALPQLIDESDLMVLLPSRVAETFATQAEVVARAAPIELPEFEVKLHLHTRHDPRLRSNGCWSAWTCGARARRTVAPWVGRSRYAEEAVSPSRIHNLISPL